MKSITNDNVQVTNETILKIAIFFDNVIRKYTTYNEKPVIDWQTKTNLIGKMKITMEDYLIDEVKRAKGIPLTFDDIDRIVDSSVEVAKLWIK